MGSRPRTTILVGLGAGWLLVSLWIACQVLFPFDFAINWTAAQGWRRGLSAYDWPALHLLGQQLVGHAEMDQQYQAPFASYINPPSTALLHLPFTLLPFDLAQLVYRGAVIAAGAAAVALIVRTVPLADQPRARR